MSSSSRLFGDGEAARLELPVFVTPNELILSPNKRRSLLTVFNPYGNEAQFRIMTTSPDRYDVSLTKGVIKPNRRIDITIRLLSHKLEELPEPLEESRPIDYFRVSVQIGSFKGNKPVKVHWCANAEMLDTADDNQVHLMTADDKTKIKLKSMKHSSSSIQLSPPTSPPSQRPVANQRSSLSTRNRPQMDHSPSGSNVNLFCTICAIACVVALFLPLALDLDLCKKAKLLSENTSTRSDSLLAQITTFLSVSYEMKMGCSFALGLFTYRLISTLPD